jgi:hypothetical protein
MLKQYREIVYNFAVSDRSWSAHGALKGVFKCICSWPHHAWTGTDNETVHDMWRALRGTYLCRYCKSGPSSFFTRCVGTDSFPYFCSTNNCHIPHTHTHTHTHTHHHSITIVDSGWNVMAHGDARERKWRGNWRMEWVASTLHATSEHGVSSIITADVHTSAASSRLNWRPRRFKWTFPFRRKTKSGFCACAIIFQMQCTAKWSI